MVDTVRTLAALQTLLADNTGGDIGAQDLRDLLVSVYPPEPELDRVETSESTTSESYGDLATAGPAVSVTIAANGLLVINLGAGLRNLTVNGGAGMAYALSGANTVSPAGDHELAYVAAGSTSDGFFRIGRTFVLTGLDAGATTITAKYRRISSNGTAVFFEREISAWAPGGSF